MTYPRPIFSFVAGIMLAAGGFVPIALDAAAHPQGHQHETMKSGESVPGESIYQLTATLTDQNGKKTRLDALRGHPTLITMFYASCQSVCPVLATTLQRMEAELTSHQRDQLRVVMISFDPKRDSVKALGTFVEAHKIDSNRWLLARASDDTVREIAAVLGIRYRPLPDGGFSHSATIILLDGNGVIRARTESLQQQDGPFMKTMRALLAAS